MGQVRQIKTIREEGWPAWIRGTWVGQQMITRRSWTQCHLSKTSFIHSYSYSHKTSSYTATEQFIYTNKIYAEIYFR